MDDFYSDTNWKLIYFDTSAQSESCERTLSLVTCIEPRKLETKTRSLVFLHRTLFFVARGKW